MRETVKRRILENFVFHVRHEARPQTKLLKFHSGRTACWKRLWKAGRKHKASVLNYHISPEELQMVLAGDSNDVTDLLRRVSSSTAGDRKQAVNIEGPFWKTRYSSTLIQHGVHLLRCNLTIDRTMVFKEENLHPCEWLFSGIHDITERKKRYKLVDVDKLAKLSCFENRHSMKRWYTQHLRTSPDIMCLKPEELNSALAVGDLEHIEMIATCFSNRISVSIKLIADDKFGKSYGLFVPRKTRRAFTRSIK